MQHFTAAAVQRETRVDAEQHDEAISVAERAVSWWQEDPRVYGRHINIWQYQYTFIDGLERPVTYPLREVFEDEMLPLINWVEAPDAIIRGRTVQQPKENVNIYLPIRAGSAVWTSNLMTPDDLIWLITWWKFWLSLQPKHWVILLQNTCETFTFLSGFTLKSILNPLTVAGGGTCSIDTVSGSCWDISETLNKPVNMCVKIYCWPCMLWC